MSRKTPDPVALRHHAEALRRAVRGRDVRLTMRLGDVLFLVERCEIGPAITMPSLDSGVPVSVAVVDLLALLEPPRRRRRR